MLSVNRGARTRAFFAAAVLVLKPYGPVSELVKGGAGWHGFHDDGPVLVMTRAQKVPGTEAAFCRSWIDALMTDPIGHDLGAASKLQYAAATPDWGPWKSEEIDGIETCDKLPCDVKLDASETAEMAASPRAARRAKYLALILERVRRYQKTQERKEYEFPGDPVDPWKLFETLGLKSPLPIPPANGPKSRLELRRVEFFPGRVKTMHQVLDTRVAEASDGQEATLWRRDAYTDHYFDSWGEWMDVGCDASGVTVTQAVMLELDLMKKTDVLSKLMRSKMRGAAEDNGAIYLNNWFERLKKKALGGK